MANGCRLIDAYKLEDLVRSNSARYHHVDDVIAAIAGQPTVDAVEVARCKDCLYWDRTAPLADSCRCNFRTTEIHAEYTKADGFCSDAVFRESEDVSAPQWVKEPTNDPNIVTESIG